MRALFSYFYLQALGLGDVMQGLRAILAEPAGRDPVGEYPPLACGLGAHPPADQAAVRRHTAR